jgi:predicted DCC family thiol-disulfide oxidoreductase YuxK
LNLVLFDGVCVLCDASMRWILERDRGERLRFAPLQGPTARELLSRHPAAPDGLSTVLYVRDFGGRDERLYLRSDAAAAILEDLGGRYRLLALFRFIPRPVRDAAYDWIAARRYRLFGKLDACSLPETDADARFFP